MGSLKYASSIVSNIISNFLMINYGALSVSEMVDSPVYCRSEELFKQFLTDTEKFYNKYHCVADYARRLCISTKYLTQIARAKTGMSPKELIDEVTLRRALTLLKDSNKSVKEISIDFGFPNPGYFSRFIKRMMGITPQEFREE